MKTNLLSLTAALLVGLGLAACASDAPRFPYGTEMQPTASPAEVQEENPQAQGPGLRTQ
jgi:hypothetical protein